MFPILLLFLHQCFAVRINFPFECGVNGVGYYPGAESNPKCYPVFESDYHIRRNLDNSYKYANYFNDPRIRDMMKAQLCTKPFRECDYRMKPEGNETLVINFADRYHTRVCVGCPIKRTVYMYDAVNSGYYFDTNKLENMLTDLDIGMERFGIKRGVLTPETAKNDDLKIFLTEFYKANDYLKYYMTCGSDTRVEDLRAIFKLSGEMSYFKYDKDPSQITDYCLTLEEPHTDKERLVIVPTPEDYETYIRNFQPSKFEDTLEYDQAYHSLAYVQYESMNLFYHDLPKLVSLAEKYNLEINEWTRNWLNQHMHN